MSLPQPAEMTGITADDNGNASAVTLGVNGTALGMDTLYFYQTEQLIFLWVLFVMIVVGNGSVLAAISLSETGKRTRMNFFIMHLAIADLSAGLINVLTDIVWKTTIYWYAGNVLCKIIRYFQAVVTIVSTYILVSLSVDRFDAIAWPMNFSGSAFRAKKLIFLAWILAILFSIPILFINNEREIHPAGVQCWIHLPEIWQWQLYVTLLAFGLFIMPALIITICYTVIVYVIWTKGKSMKEPTENRRQKTVIYTSSSPDQTENRKTTSSEVECVKSSSRGNRKTTSSEVQCAKSSSRGVIPQAKIRTIKMTLVIVIVFILCWSPYFVFDLLDVYGHFPLSQRKIAIATFIQSLAPLNSAANPIIYGMFSTRICRNLRRIPVLDCIADVICCCKHIRKGKRRFSMFTGSWSDQTHGTDSSNGKKSKLANRRPSGLPLVQRQISEKDNAILLRSLTVKMNKGPDSGFDTDAATEL